MRADTTTVTDTRPANAAETVTDPAPGGPPGASQRELIASYRAIIRERCIRGPVLYRFVKKLGHGRQGVVFLAVRHGARGCLTKHAVKVLDPGIYSSAESYWTDMARIAGQVSKLQPVSSDNLVSRDLYDEFGGIGYLQMSAVDGVDIGYLLDGTHLAIARGQCNDREWKYFSDVLFCTEEGKLRLRPGAALHILRKLLLGVEALHEAGFVHGDLKPSNIMIDRKGSVKVVDFGRAIVIGERPSILLGTPLFMAPEAHRREPCLAQTDLFSAGLVGLEMLTGSALSEYADWGEDELLALKTSLCGRLEAMLPHDIAGNELMVAALRRFLDPDPANRYASAAEAEDDRERGLRGVYLRMPRNVVDMAYARILERYLDKLSDPVTGALNPTMEWE